MAMKSRLLVLLIVIGIILGLSGCRDAALKTKTLDESALKTAKTVYDVAPLMTMRENDLIYSELKDHKDLDFYFDILKNDQYIIVKYMDNDYLLLWYYFYSYTEGMTEVSSVDKNYAADELKLNVKAKKKSITDDGCFPIGSYCRLILKLDQYISRLYVNDKPYGTYNGGYVKICDMEGLIDKDLNFLIPPIYKGIYELNTLEKSSCPTYYRVYDGHNGVLDNNYKPVLSTSYDNIYYINENKFIVGIGGKEPIDDEIAILDGKENVIKKMKGFLKAKDENNHHQCADGHIMICDPSFHESWGDGIADTDLNIILKPVYRSIFWDNGIYKVENYDGETVRFNVKGELA